MAQTTGPVLAIGGITLANQVIFNGKPMDWRIPIATGLTAGGFALLEKLSPELASGLAWIALVSVLFVRLNPSVPAPAESAVKWFNQE
jgi:hypothetical protein